ncbi:RNA-directed DNA polymerase [Iodobacter sp. HSC-16F04]|uniref:RNA-directed DNA polymerase n=1 Tax=Iodobacter violaceini TaxID=3044271 RepID=A0ABX0KM10_9NEIS|nr:reverse transcriptase family protein [Iodobacter violacea]NHQ85268.1 RNA-directed DNA polymerase [Iodobacter violacea]
MASKHKIYYDGLPIGSIKTLAKTLSCTEARLIKISTDPSFFYTTFLKTVKNKNRELSEPNPELKLIQKRIVSRIFNHIKFPHYLHGGIKALDPRDFHSNAKAHSGAETAITLDIKNFFPSIKADQVENLFLHLFKFPPNVSSVMSKLTTLNNCIPQGAPTSSYISNLILTEKEYRIAAKLESQGFIYTRLIDDITISSKKELPEKKITQIITNIAGMLTHYNFELHPEKVHIYSRSNPEKLMVITGLWLNRGMPRIEKSRRLQISNDVIAIAKLATSSTGTSDASYHEKFNAASGKVALLQRFKHTEARRLRAILNEIQPTYNDYDKCKINKLAFRFLNKKTSKETIGYLKKFYQFQYRASIIKRTDPALAKRIQEKLNLNRPTSTKKAFYE